MAETKNKPDNTSIRKAAERRVKAMKGEAQSWLPTWKEIKKFINPLRGFFSDQPNKGHAIDHKTMLDEHPRICSRIMSSGIGSGMTSQARPWFKLGVEDPDLMEVDNVKLWLDVVQERMLNVFSRSNIYDVLNSVYDELSSFGTAAAIILEDPQTIIRGRNFTIGEYWLSIGPDGRVNGFARKYWLTVGQLVKEFGIENVSPTAKTTYENSKNIDKWVAVFHLIEENDDRVPDKADFKNMPYRSIQWEDGSPHDCILRIGGYEEFPVLAPRWSTTTTADVYGKGPGWEALGAAKMLQKMQRKKLLGLDKTVDPPVQKDGMVSGEVNTLPGGVTTSSANVPNAGVRATYQVKMDINGIEGSIEKTHQKLNSIFYTDLFLMLHQSDTRQRTAREIAEKHEEKMWMVSPLLEPLESQLLDLLIDRTFAIMLRVGLIPTPPIELQGEDLKVEYISVLAQAQKMVGTTAIEQVCSFATQLSQVNTDILHKIDFDEALETYAEMVGTPAKILRTAEAVAAIRRAKQEAELRMKQAQSGLLAAEGAKTLSQAKIGQDNKGQNSALDAVIAALTGKPMPAMAEAAAK